MSSRMIGAALALCLFAMPAAAQQQPTQQLTDEQRSGLDEEARQLFETGEVAYANGRYARAYDYFAEAYELSHRALILYNMGLSAELARRDEQALAAYRGYLEAVPDSPQHGRVRTRIGVLEQRLAEGGGQDPEPAPPSAIGRDPQPSQRADAGGGGIVGWILFGGGIAIAATGGTLLGVAASDVSRVEGAPQGAEWSEYEDSASRAEPMTIAGVALLGVGVALAAVGLVLALTDSGSDENVSLRVSPTGLALLGSFR